MQSNAKLNNFFWGKAVTTACYLIKDHLRLLLSSRHQKPPNYENLRIFGCTAYIHTSEGKLEPRSKKGIFLVIQKVEESL